MTTSMFASLFSERLLKAISWTLVHSFWQGLILAILTALVIVLTRRARPSVRYNLFLFLFVAQVVASGVTFYGCYKAAGGNKPVLTMGAAVAGRPGGPGPKAVAAAGFVDNARSGIEAYLDKNTALIVNIWLLAELFLLLRLLAGMRYLQKVRLASTYPASAGWLQRLQELGVDMHLRRAVEIKESTVIQAPVVIGFLKPLILVPMGLLANLPADQMEAILYHELAHIRRCDYLVNILQTIVEGVFFFNPAIWWVSALIRDEREHCCDDLALSYDIDKKTLVEALVAFQEYSHRLQLTPGFAGQTRQHQLLKRVKRIFYRENNALSPLIQSMLAGCTVLCLCAMFAFKGSRNIVPLSGHPVTRTDTVPGDRNREMRRQLRQLEEDMEGKQGEQWLKLRHAADSLTMRIDAGGGDFANRKNREALAADRKAEPDQGGGQDLVVNKNYTQREISLLDVRSTTGSAPEKQYTAEELKRLVEERRQKEREGDLFFQGLITDLLADKLIASKQDAHFYLSKSKFVINDKEQSPDLLQKYVAKYLKKDGTAIVYRYHGEMVGWMDDSDNPEKK